MNTYAQTSALTRFGRHIADFVAECNYAQRRMLALRTNPDAFRVGGAKAPGTYAEFLFRTSGARLHEPAASGRAQGRTVG